MNQYAYGSTVKPLTVNDLAEMKQHGEKITCLTAYDAGFSALIDKVGIDVMLVGDSLGMVIQGHDSTLPVTINDMVYQLGNVCEQACQELQVEFARIKSTVR